MTMISIEWNLLVTDLTKAEVLERVKDFTTRDGAILNLKMEWKIDKFEFEAAIDHRFRLSDEKVERTVDKFKVEVTPTGDMYEIVSTDIKQQIQAIEEKYQGW